MAAGYDIGLSASQSTSSGASQSGALDTSSGARLGTLGYGPGSVVYSAPTSAASSPLTWIVIAVALVVGAVLILPAIFGRKR